MTTTRICTLAILPAFLGLAPTAAPAVESMRGVSQPQVDRWLINTPVLELPARSSLAAGSAPASGQGPTNCGITERVSVASDGTEGNGSGALNGFAPAVSADGRYVAFSSAATNLVPDDTNGTTDVFVHDRETGITERVSVASDGTEGNAISTEAAMSANGRYVAFQSFASNLVPDDTNDAFDMFVHDRETGITERVSIASDGSEGNDSAFNGPAISADGRFVAFDSRATNLVPDDTNGVGDVFVHDRETGITERVSVASDGSQGNGLSVFPAISADGRFVAFTSVATNLVADDTNNSFDAFVHDRQTGTTERVSVASDGTEGNLNSTRGTVAISADGRFVVFSGGASNLVPDDTNDADDVFVHDRETGLTERVSVASDGTEGNDNSGSQAISSDGRFVAFLSLASNLVPDDTNEAFDAFLHDRATEQTVRVSVASDCTEGNGNVAFVNITHISLSGDGRHIAFYHTSSNLVPDDTNDAQDVFVNTRPELATTPEPLDFGPVLVGQTRGPLSVTLTNASPENVTISEISDPDAPFTAEGGTCGAVPITLAPDGSCELEFSFSPTVPGAVSDTVTLTSDAPSSPNPITLRGMGSEDPLGITPEELDFGEVATGDTGGPLSVTLTNADPDTAALEVGAVSPPDAPFTAAGGTCEDPPFTLDPFASCTLDYTFIPIDAGSFSDVAEVTSDTSGSPHSFILQGEGLLRQLMVAPGLHDFGAVPVGETAPPSSVTLTNTGDVDVTLSSVSAPGAPFTPLENTCAFVTLPPDAICTLSYTFSPTAPGDATAEVTIASDAPSSPDTITLQGTGLGAAIDVDPESLAATLEPGQTETQPLEITNLGNDPLEWAVTEDPETNRLILRPAGSVTLPVTVPPSGAVAGFARAAETQGAALAPYPFPPSSTGATTLTHSESLDIFDNSSVACVMGENHFLRTFTLTDFGLLGAFDVTEVTFGIETVDATVPITVNLYTLEGEFVFDNLTLIGTATEDLEAQNLTLVTVPVTSAAPAGSTLVAEIVDLPSAAAFLPGSNNLGETAPSYIAASACGVDEPTTMADLLFPDVHLVMTVTGTAEEIDCALPTWVNVEPLSGSVPGGETLVADVTFDATGLSPGELEANLCLNSNDPNRPVTVVPLALTVTGGGGGAELTFDPASLDFGDIEVGTTSAPQTTTLQNTGDIDATGITFTLPGSGFEADTRVCGDTLPAGEGCPVSVTFTPAGAGPAEASLEASSAEGASAALSLTGNGIGEGFTPMALEVDSEPFLADGNGVFEPGETVEVAPAWRNDGPDMEPLTGTASDFNGPDGAIYVLFLDDADYANVEPGATASCRDTGVCYFLAVNNPVVRPATHWEASVEETVSDDTTQTWSLHVGASFLDVPPTSPFYPSVETLLHSGVTGGCTDTEYCPAGSNTRAQMAVFLLKAVEGDDYLPPACVEGEEMFLDVPAGSTFCPWIEELAARDVTSGCGGDNYCPGDSVTRGQIAVFLLEALEGEGYSPPECTGAFTDVTCPSPFADWIEELAARGITGGCSADPPAYCPAAPMTRQQMAVFVTKTFGLTLYGP